MSQSANGRMPPYHTAVRSAFLVAMHCGTHLQAGHIAVGDHKDALGSVQRILDAAGLEARPLKNKTWDDVRAMRGQYPLMTVCKDDRWVIVVGEVPTPGIGAGEGGPTSPFHENQNCPSASRGNGHDPCAPHAE